MSRLVIEVSDDQHQEIKALAALEGISIKQYILSKVFSDNASNEAMDELKEILEKRMLRAESGHVSKKSFSDIANETIEKNTL